MTDVETGIHQTIRAIVESTPDDTKVSVTVAFNGEQPLDIDGDNNYPSASTIKILILAALAREFDAGRLNPEDRRPAPAGIRLDGSGVVNWLDPDIELTLRDHAWLMTAISDNTTSNVLIDAVCVERINEVGQELGAGGTVLGRQFMANPPPGPSRNRATTNGLVNILTAIWSDTAASPERCAWMRQLLSDQQHVDRLPRHLPEGISYAGKTGTIHQIAHDCGVLTGPNGRAIVAVLTQGFENPYDADRLIGRIGTAIGEQLIER